MSVGEEYLRNDPAPAIARVLGTDQSRRRRCRGGQAPQHDLGVETRLGQWRIVRWGPGFSLPMQNTDTIDCLIESGVELILNDGARPQARELRRDRDRPRLPN